MEKINLSDLTQMMMELAKDKGFGTKPEDINVAEKMLLIQSEVNEAYDAYRHKNMTGKHGFEEELGDVIQRVLHLCGIFQIDIEKVILEKLEINKNRTWN